MIPGFGHFVVAKWRDIFLQWDFGLAVGLAIVLALVVPGDHLEAGATVLFATVVGVLVALLGLVLAGMSLVLAHLRDDVLLQLSETGEGLAEDVFPFSFTALLSAVAAGTSLAFLVAVPMDDERWLRVSAGFTLWLFTWTLLSVVSLVAVVYEYGEVRASAIRRQGGDGTAPRNQQGESQD